MGLDATFQAVEGVCHSERWESVIFAGSLYSLRRHKAFPVVSGAIEMAGSGTRSPLYSRSQWGRGKGVGRVAVPEPALPNIVDVVITRLVQIAVANTFSLA